MTQIIQAIYANGVFRPLKTLDLPENQQVQIIVETTGQNVVASTTEGEADDPLAGLETSTGIRDLAEHFDDYRFGVRPASV